MSHLFSEMAEQSAGRNEIAIVRERLAGRIPTEKYTEGMARIANSEANKKQPDRSRLQ